MTLEINLKPDQCREYKSWAEYLKDSKDSSVLDLTKFSGPEDYLKRGFNSTARNRLRHSLRNDYFSRLIPWKERTEYLQDIHEINVSRPERQSKPMDAHYLEFPKIITGEAICPNHWGSFVGCLGILPGSLYEEMKLYAYITTNFVGEMAAASQILGHGDYLKDGIMLNVWFEFVRLCMERGIKYIVYSRWNDGHDGLRYWKQSVGMEPMILREKQV